MGKWEFCSSIQSPSPTIFLESILVICKHFEDFLRSFGFPACRSETFMRKFKQLKPHNPAAPKHNKDRTFLKPDLHPDFALVQFLKLGMCLFLFTEIVMPVYLYDQCSYTGIMIYWHNPGIDNLSICMGINNFIPVVPHPHYRGHLDCFYNTES